MIRYAQAEAELMSVSCEKSGGGGESFGGGGEVGGEGGAWHDLAQSSRTPWQSLGRLPSTWRHAVREVHGLPREMAYAQLPSRADEELRR